MKIKILKKKKFLASFLIIFVLTAFSSVPNTVLAQVDPISAGAIKSALGGLLGGDKVQKVEIVKGIQEKEIGKKTSVKLPVIGVKVSLPQVPCVTGSKDQCAWVMAKVAATKIASSLVKWSRNGFRGNPVFVTDPGKFFGDLADNVAGEFIAGSDLNVLCSPFQSQIRLALQSSYNMNSSSEGYLQRGQCTLTNVVANAENFINGDFNQGGWDGWFALTQESQNNPYGATLEAKLELNRRIEQSLGIEQTKLAWGKGFLSITDCKKMSAGTAAKPAVLNLDGSVRTPAVPAKPGGCIEEGDIKTPGSIVEGQLNQVLGSNQRSLEIADELDEVLGSVVKNLIEKVGAKIFGSEEITKSGGLLGSNNGGGGGVNDGNGGGSTNGGTGTTGGGGGTGVGGGGGGTNNGGIPEQFTLFVLGDNPMTLTVGDYYDEPGAAAYDPNDGPIDDSITITGEPDTSTAGTYYVTYDVTNSSGQSLTATRTINVVAETTDTATPTNGGSTPGGGQSGGIPVQ